jgi:hypothetical protein
MDEVLCPMKIQISPYSPGDPYAAGYYTARVELAS